MMILARTDRKREPNSASQASEGLGRSAYRLYTVLQWVPPSEDLGAETGKFQVWILPSCVSQKFQDAPRITNDVGSAPGLKLEVHFAGNAARSSVVGCGLFGGGSAVGDDWTV